MKNGAMMQFFEWNLPNDGKFWQKLKEEAKHLHDIGITSVWIPPAYKADEQQDEGYATYDLFDLGEFDQKNTVRTKYGTKQELIDAITECHKYQISVYLDAVLNHKADGEYTEKFMVKEVYPNDRLRDITDQYEIEAYTGYNFPNRDNKYSDFKWHWYHFSGTDWDAEHQRKAIYRIMGDGKYWSKGVDGENGNYDYLMCNDIDHDHPEVIKELNRWGRWVSNELNLDGFRLDAIKHIEEQFTANFLKDVRSDRGDNFYAVGEYWKGDFDTLESYINLTEGKLDLFDVPLHYKMYTASHKGRDFDLTSFPEEILVTKFPANAVTFVDNHDSQRGSSLESQVDLWFKPLAYGLILLMEKGYPCVFYGDYYGIGGEPSPHRIILDILLDARQKYAFGKQNMYFDHPNTVGLTREGDDIRENSGLALLLSNGEDGDKIMYVGTQHKGEIWHKITGSIPDEVTIGDDCKAQFKVRGGKVAVWVKK